MKKLLIFTFLLLLNTSLFSSPSYEDEAEDATPEYIQEILLKYENTDHEIYNDKNKAFLFISEYCRNKETMLFMLDYGADPNYIDLFGVNAYDKYLRNSESDEDIFNQIFKKINKDDPINIFKYGSIIKIDEYKNNNNPEIINEILHGFYPIELIIRFNDEEVLNYFLNFDNINIDLTPNIILDIFRYLNYSSEKIIMLVEAGFNINCFRIASYRSYHTLPYDINIEGYEFNEYPIVFALRIGVDEDTIKTLIENGSILNAVDGKFYMTTLHYAFSYIHDKEILEEFINSFNDVNIKDAYGRTPLYYAMNNQHIENIELLFNAGGDFNIECGIDGLPVHRLMYRDDPEVILYVIENTININLKNQKDGRTPLIIYCVSHDNMEIIKILFEHVADPTISDLYDNNSFYYIQNNFRLSAYFEDIMILWNQIKEPS